MLVLLQLHEIMSGNETLKVNSITLDEIAIKYELERLDFIKLDIRVQKNLQLTEG